MPRKTFKQKLLAEKHHQSGSFSFTYQPKAAAKSTAALPSASTSLVFTDLKKTLILGTLFILAEVALAAFFKF